MLPDRTWPFHVRPVSFETVDSYLQRLRTANLVTDVTWRAWLKSTIRKTGMSRVDLLPALAERVGGLRPGHFAHSSTPTHADGSTCEKCVTGLNARFGCVRCTLGERVEQRAHDGPRVCRRHMMWVGPGVAPESQRQVAVDALRADRRYRRLRRKGLLDAHRLAEIEASIEMWATAEDRLVPPSERFVVAVALASTIFRPGALDTYMSRDVNAADRYAALSAVVVGIVGDEACIPLIDDLWLLVRATGHQDQSDPHSFVCTQKRENQDERGELEQLRTSAYPRWHHLHLTQYVSSTFVGTRFERIAQGGKKYHYACARGHVFEQRLRTLKATKTTVGCGVCANRTLLRGFNSLADTHPHLASEWHPTKNGDLRPHDVIAGSPDEVFWLCELNHTYETSLSKRKKGVGCGYCANRLVDPSINALSFTHPAAAAEWHPERNGERTPEQVVAGSSDFAWWTCPEHDAYEMRIANHVVLGHGCTYCGRSKVHPKNCLAVTHPDTASRWHPTRNGSLTPFDVLSGSGKEVWWLCKEKNHHYSSRVHVQSRGNECNICTGRVVDEQNCMRTTRPDLAQQFHPTMNGSLTPDNVLATTTKTVHWLCENGHDWPATGQMRGGKGTGCRYCANSAVWLGWNDMATTHPHLVAEWDWDANGDLTPHDVVAGTNKHIAWKCNDCGHRWPAQGADRSVGGGCPDCARKRRRRTS